MGGLGSLDGLSLCPTLDELFRENQPEVILHTASSSAAGLMHVPEVNGALVGGASLKGEEFWAIALAAASS